MLKYALALATALAFAAPAEAQHKHGAKGPNGGIMEDVAGVHAELVASGNTITINVFDEDNKAVKVSGYAASVLVVNGQDRETVKLNESGTNALKGETKKAIAANTQVTLQIKTAAGKSGQARFKVEK